MDLETLCRAMLEIVEDWGGVPWAWVFGNMKTVTLERDAAASPLEPGVLGASPRRLASHPELRDPSAASRTGPSRTW
jgi:hypothetical protein